jgi:hypothetical protein
MKKYRSQLSLDRFDHGHPTVSRAKETYKDFKDMTIYEGLTRSEIAESVLNLKENNGLIIPAGTYWGNEKFRHRKTGSEIEINSPARFRKFGPEIDIVSSGMTIKEIKDSRLTPRKAFLKALSDPSVRENLLNCSYRGIGFWSPRARRHNIIWFDVLAEGQAYLDFFKNEFETIFQFADAYQDVPSFKQIEGVRTTLLKVLPVTERNGEYFIEWLEEFAQCSCADAFFMGAKSRKKTKDESEGIFKYINPEQIVCRHNWAQRQLAEKEAESNPNMKPLLVRWPRATGLMEPWRKAKTHVFVSDEGGLRRPYKAELGPMMGNILGTMNPHYAFDLSE